MECVDYVCCFASRNHVHGRLFLFILVIALLGTDHAVAEKPIRYKCCKIFSGFNELLVRFIHGSG